MYLGVPLCIPLYLYTYSIYIPNYFNYTYNTTHKNMMKLPSEILDDPGNPIPCINNES